MSLLRPLLTFAGIAFWALHLTAAHVPATNAHDWLFLDNGVIKLGVKTNSGACIGWFGPSGSGRNLLNHYDQGRFIQQSYYGAPDGSLWNQKPWRWNPVQGGDWRGAPAKLLAFEATRTNLFAATLPKHWASGVDLPEVRMEQRLTLEGPVARLAFRMTYRGTNAHPVSSHELPAVFIDFALSNFVYYSGAKPWTGDAVTNRVPGWPNQGDKITENWAAYVGAGGRGVGVFVPGVTQMTFYRFNGKPGPLGSGCSYFAPVKKFAITNGTDFRYEAFLTLGTVPEMRERFAKIHRANTSKD